MRSSFLLALVAVYVADAFLAPLEPSQFFPELISDLKALDSRPPLVLIPPMTGTIMEAALHDAKVPHLYCPKNQNWKQVWWPAETQMLPGLVDCWANSFTLVYNESTDTYSSRPGVEIRLNNSLAAQITSPGAYSAIGPALVKYLGYVPGKDLVTFPYDWRLGPHQFTIPGGYFSRMKTFLEQTYAANGNQTLLILSMSMGSPWFVDFLNRYVTDEWKAQYINTMFSLSGVFAGAPVATENQVAFSQGWSSHTIPPSIQSAVLQVARSFGSVAWMAPPAAYWNDTIFFSTTAGATYTASQFGQLFRASGANVTAEMWEAASPFTVLAAPNVRMFAYYGYNVSTPHTFVYAPNFPGNPKITYVSGDGVASVASLATVVQDWSNAQSEAVTVRGYFNCTHADTLFRPDVIKALLDDIYSVINGTAPSH